MVIAGPGTGKTQIVAMRVANILRKTQMRPSNILCLTFSNTGAKAMRERLRSIIGPDAYGVTVGTIHSFCNDLILQHPHIFEDFRALEQISSIERLRVIRSLLKDLPTGSVLGKPSLENDRAAAIASRISEMKREGISVETLRSLVPTYRAEIRVTKNGRERDTLSQSYRDDLRLVQQFEEFIEVFEGYGKVLQETHRYDFDDMILVTEVALKKHDWLLSSLQERYQYILIDEYQDMNGAQNRMIETLTTYVSVDHAPNLFVVGDDDQAIYRFQGASIGNMMAFLERFPEAQRIPLSENYRSTQAILDAATMLIEKNVERLAGKVAGIEKKLKAVQKRVTSSSAADFSIRTSATPSPRATRSDTAARIERSPCLLRYPSLATEHAGIAELLRSEHKRGTPWNEMAVLCRRNEELIELDLALRAAAIPTVVKAAQDLLIAPSIRQAIAILRAVAHPNEDSLLATALAAETFDVHPADLGRLWIAHRTLNRERLEGTSRQSLHEYLFTVPDASLPSPMREARDLIEHFMQKQDLWTLPELVFHILKDTKLLPPKEMTEADPEVIAVLHAFYDYVSSRAKEQKSLTLFELLLDLDDYSRDKHLHLEYALPHVTSDGVQLLTAHGAKGLEFRLVIIAHSRFRNWGNRLQGSLLSLPDHLIFSLDPDVQKRAGQEDERRLFYVAMTRAKECVVLTFPETYRSGEEMRSAEVSSFIADLGESIQEVTIPPVDVPAPIETLYVPNRKIDEAFRAFLLERLENFQLSATALNTFLRDPQEFLWTQLLQQPQATEAHLAYGSAIHRALEARNLAWQEGATFSTAELIAAFELGLSRREIMTAHHREHYSHAGKLLLTRYAKETENDRPIILSTERSLSARLPSDIPLFGRVDRIDLFQKNGNKCRIVDYKTGKPYRTPDAVKKADGIFRQLVFYKLLCDHSPSFTHDATIFTLDFLGDEKNGRSVIEFEITEKDVRELMEVIREVWGRITALNFTA